MGAEFQVIGTDSVGAAAPLTASTDAMASRVLANIKLFTDWLTLNNQQGFLGEFGWPNDQGAADSSRWNAVAEAFYAALDAAGCWATTWIVSEQTPYHDQNLYSPGSGKTTVQPMTLPTATARVMESHPTISNFLRGVNMSSGENGADITRTPSSFSNAREYPGWAFGATGPLVAAANGAAVPEVNQASYTHSSPYAKLWNYGSLATYRFLAIRGVKLIRLPFRWERMQRTLGGALDATEIARLDQAVSWIGACGMQVMLDCHNFGYYYLDNGSQGVATSIGGATVTKAHFADLWSKVASRYASSSAVIAYDLCNEPAGATAWSSASGPAQSAVTAIRAAGATQTIIVSGPNFSAPGEFTGVTPWITDSLSNFRYQAHAYWDFAAGVSSSYVSTYATELASAVAAGFGATPGAAIVVKTYAPSAYTLVETDVTALTDVDATNLAVTFVAPASGRVLVRLSALVELASPAVGYYWALREGSTEIARNLVAFTNVTFAPMMTVPILVTGLTPGSAHTYKWAHGTFSAGHTGGMSMGDGIGAGRSAATMEVLAA